MKGHVGTTRGHEQVLDDVWAACLRVDAGSACGFGASWQRAASGLAVVGGEAEDELCDSPLSGSEKARGV